MEAVPLTRPLTTPVVLTEPVAGALLLQEPPGVPLVSVIVEPWHTCDGPAMAAGTALTVTNVEVVQPVPIEYLTDTTPCAVPVTIPDKDPTKPKEEAGVMLQVPPPTRLLRGVVAPTHTCGVPPMADGPALTVTVVVALHAPSV
jgi:hypothetical protein